MDLINDLGCELAFAVLVEKKYNEKIQLKDILPLIGRIENALQSISETNDSDQKILIAEPSANFATH